MKQFLLAAMLVAVPVAAFTAFQLYFHANASAADTSLGDLSSMKVIITDVQSIAETAWDEAEAKLRPMNKAAWANVDAAADAALHTLRKAPEAAKVTETLAALVAALDNPSGSAEASGGVKQVSGIAVTDDTGHPIACENMLKLLGAALDGGKIPDANKAAATDFQAKATERCNADDDAHADEFSAQGLALAGK
jgi:hypothetical protein